MIIWLASYPKSGNTWLRSLIATYFYSKDGLFDFDLLKNIDQFPQQNYFKDFEDNFEKPESTSDYWLKAQNKINQDKKIKFFKTHNAMCKINKNLFTDENNTLGAIYIIRDPRNVVTSLANHINLNVSDAFEYMLKEDNSFSYKKDGRYLAFVPLLSWALHQKSWISSKRFPVLTIRYEDLQNKTFDTFKEVINFIKSISKSNKSFDREKAKKVVQSCQFEKMKKMEKEKGFNESVMKKSEDKKIDFFHLGPKNNFKELLNKDIISEMNSIYKDELKEFKYE